MKQKEENSLLSYKFYTIVKSVNDNYLNYLKSFKTISSDYFKKLYNLHNENISKVKEISVIIKKYKNIDFSSLITIANIFPNVFSLYIENLATTIKNIEKEIINYENMLKEKEILVNKFIRQFEETKTDFIKKEELLNKSKKTFFDSMNNIEELLYEFYSFQKKKNLENIQNNKMTEENINNIIIFYIYFFI